MSFTIATSAVGLAAVMVTTRLLPPSQYGVIGIFFSVLFFVTPIVSVAADGLIAVNKCAMSQDDFRQFQRTYVGVAYSAFALLQVLFICGWVAGVYADTLVLGAPLFGLVRFLSGMATTEYVVEQRPIAFGVVTLANAAFSLLLTVVLVHGMGPFGGCRVFAMFAADVMMLLVRYRGKLSLLVKPSWNSKTVTQVLSYGLPSLLAVAGGWALNESDKLVVARVLGLHDAGIYAAVAGLASIMLVFNQSVTNAFYPTMFRQFGENPRAIGTVVARYVGIFSAMAAMFAGAMIGFYFMFAELLLPIRYRGGGAVFIALVLSGVAVGIYRPVGLMSEFLQLGKLRALAIICGGTAALLIGVLGVSSGGMVWAPVGIAVGYLFAAVIIAAGRPRENGQ